MNLNASWGHLGMATNLGGKALFHIVQSMETCWFLSKNGGIIEIESDLHVSPSSPALRMAIVKARTSCLGSCSAEV